MGALVSGLPSEAFSEPAQSPLDGPARSFRHHRYVDRHVFQRKRAPDVDWWRAATR